MRRWQVGRRKRQRERERAKEKNIQFEEVSLGKFYLETNIFVHLKFVTWALNKKVSSEINFIL